MPSNERFNEAMVQYIEGRGLINFQENIRTPNVPQGKFRANFNFS